MLERFKRRHKQDGKGPIDIGFAFPVGKDPHVIAEHLEQVMREKTEGNTLPQAPSAEGTAIFDSAEVVQEYMEKDPSAVFLGDDLVVDNQGTTRSDGAAIKGVSNPIITRELLVDSGTGAMRESVVAVEPDVNGAITYTLRSRLLRKPLEG